MEVVHQVVLGLQRVGQRQIAFAQHHLGLLGQVHGDGTHPLEHRPHLRGQHRARVPPPGGLGHVDRQLPHPLQVGHDPQRRDDDPQVGRDGRLQREQLERDILDAGPHVVELDVAGDHVLGEREIAVDQRSVRIAQRVGDDMAHPCTVFAEVGELDLIGLTHSAKPRPAAEPTADHPVNSK